MISRPLFKLTAVSMALLFALFMSLDVEARGGGKRGGGRSGGGGKSRSVSRSGGSKGFNRSGPASGGGFTSRGRGGRSSGNRMSQDRFRPGRPGGGGALRPGGGDRPGRPGGPGGPDRPNKPGRPDRPGKPDRPDRPGRPDRPDRPGRPGDNINIDRETNVNVNVRDRHHGHGHWGNDWDDWHRPWGYVAAGAAAAAAAYTIGSVISASMYSSLSCTPTTVVVGDVTYYQCGSTWYNRGYSGGEVNYVVVNPPPGY